MERLSAADDPDISDSGFLIAPQGMNKITELNIEIKLLMLNQKKTVFDRCSSLHWQVAWILMGRKDTELLLQLHHVLICSSEMMLQMLEVGNWITNRF